MGARLDSEPLLFFTLRGMDSKELLAKALEAKVQDIIKNSERKTSRTIEDDEMFIIFGIE